MIKAFQFTGQFTHHAQVMCHITLTVQRIFALGRTLFSRISQIKLLYLLSFLSPQSFLPIFPTHIIRDMIIGNRISCRMFHSVIIVVSYQIVFPLISRGQQIELNSL